MKSLSSLNERNAAFWGDRQQENWQPGERPIPTGPEAMISSPMQASREDYPTESAFPEVPQLGIKSSGAEMGKGQDPHSYLEPKDYDSLYRPNMGLESSPHDKSKTLSGYEHPAVPGTFSAPKETLAEINAKNQQYWESHLNISYEPPELPAEYPSEGPREEPESYGKP